VSLFFCLFTFTVDLCSHWKKTSRQLIIYSWVKRTNRRPTGLSVKYHGRRVLIGRLCPGLFVRTCIWNVSRGAVRRSWQTWTALLAWNALSFCFRRSRSMPLTLFSLRTKMCFPSLHLTICRTKSVADCGNFWCRSWAFSSVRALRGLPLPGRPFNCACLPQLFEQLINTSLCPTFLGKFVCEPLRCVLLQIQTFYLKNLVFVA